MAGSRSEPNTHLPDALARTGETLAIIAGVLLAILIVLMTVNVVLRYGFDSGIHGILEIMQIGMVLVIFLGLPHCTAVGAHIAVEMLTHILPAIFWRIINPIVDIGCAVIFAMMGWLSALRALDAHEYGDTTNFLRIPLALPWSVIALGSGATALIFAGKLFWAQTTSPERAPEDNP
ncbi:TRAP transporter small permease [Nitratireductor kimnyeongensis]|uniref:TRAP transporter small permease protein n=1 Tax=Nitratireductor kimnyeongensis TaxID=430679 RepID=A0ABW0T898_9HYPH|nr:TRAP transporter small permease [Nitratireductor kimnyeongensis]QZZ36165.1 TRAP transporter small permease [Nitratireductor kimnyeongensis]